MLAQAQVIIAGEVEPALPFALQPASGAVAYRQTAAKGIRRPPFVQRSIDSLLLLATFRLAALFEWLPVQAFVVLAIVIDGLIVGGSVRVVGLVAAMVRLFQSGHIYHYAFTMIFGVCALLSFWLLRA